MGMTRVWSALRRCWPQLPQSMPDSCALPALAYGRSTLLAMRPDSLWEPMRLVLSRSNALGDRIRAGLEGAAESGTARALQGLPVLAKTGTYPAEGELPGYGLCLTAYPKNRPEYLLLVGIRDGSGSRAAEVARRILSNAVE